LNAIKKIVMMDTDEYSRQLKAKLALIESEKTSIDLTLDESEMLELLLLLQRIISVSKKTVNNYPGLTQIKEQVKPSVDQATVNYFHKKFYVQENQNNFSNTERYLRQPLSMIRGSDATPAGRVFRTTIAGKNFFDLSSQRKIFSHYLPRSKELITIDVSDSSNYVALQSRRLENRELKIDAKTGVIQRPDGSVYFTGGYDDLKYRSHNLCYCYDLLSGQMMQVPQMIYPRSSHGICQTSNHIYVCGGRLDGDAPQKSFERYSISLNTWERLPDAPTGAIRPLLVSLNDRQIFKFGGIGGQGSDNGANCSIERFDCDKKEWLVCNYVVKGQVSQINSLGFGLRPAMAGVQIGHNTILVFGGFDAHDHPIAQTFQFTQQEELTPDQSPLFFVENVDRHNLNIPLAFTFQQAIIHDKKVLAFSDSIERDTQGRIGVISRTLVQFNGSEWNTK